MTTVRVSECSLSELLLMGFLSFDDVGPGGGVEEVRRLDAERRYSDFMQRSSPYPSRPTPRPTPVSSRPTPRPASRPNNPYPVSSRPTPRPHPTRGRSAHATRVRDRAEVTDREYVPSLHEYDNCVICFNRMKCFACVPCFHLCVCATCGVRIEQCPMCRAPTTHLQRIYL